MRIHLNARLGEPHTSRDCHREARGLVPEALHQIGEALTQERLFRLSAPAELRLLAGIAGRRFASRANAQFKRWLQGKLFDRLWWTSLFPGFDRDRLFTP